MTGVRGPNLAVEWMAAGGHLSNYRVPGVAATAHFSRRTAWQMGL
jgi:hypothetical protein